jgi:hypothetical protein
MIVSEKLAVKFLLLHLEDLNGLEKDRGVWGLLNRCTSMNNQFRLLHFIYIYKINYCFALILKSWVVLKKTGGFRVC